LSVKEDVDRLLYTRQYAGLASLAEKDRAAISHLFSLIYNPEGLTRWRAIEGLGYVGGELGRRDPDVGREIIRRLFWSLSDESGDFGWSAPEAIGEVIKNQPDLYGSFTPQVFSFFEDERLRRGVIWAMGRIGKRNPELVQDAIPSLIAALSDANPQVRGFAAWSLGEIGVEDAALELSRLRGDVNTVLIYEAGKLWQRTVGEVAMDALANIRGRVG
jgi:HEAT repeat protein